MIRKLLLSLIGATALTMMAPAHAWWNDAWSHRTRVVIDTGEKGLTLSAPVSEVVVPVRLHSGNFDFLGAKPDGSDLRVLAADDKTPLVFEIERFDAINELALIWVRLPMVQPGTDKNVLHVYAGNDKAAAEPAGKAFANAYAAVLHLSQTEGPAQDATSDAKTLAAPQAEASGLLAGAAKLIGLPIELPLAGRFKLSPDGGLSAGLWIKPETAGEAATLLALGPVKLTRSADLLGLQIGSQKLAGEALPVGAWSHVALTVAGGKAVIYLNGKMAGQMDATLPALETGLVIGEGYTGLIDEVQLLPAGRDAAWARLTAASQGPDSGFIATVKEANGEESAGGEPSYMGILVANLTVDAWVVIAILAVMFVIAGWVMWSKAVLVNRIGKANDLFLERFRADLTGKGLQDGAGLKDSNLFKLYGMGQAEIAKRQQDGRTEVSSASLAAIRATLDAMQVRENQTLNSRMVLLTIAISGGPFLGLLGTVVGVMIVFAAIAAAGDVNVNAIAPGVAAALLATVAGLSVAIPALFGYNWLASQIKNISADMQIFVDEYVTRAAEVHGQR